MDLSVIFQIQSTLILAMLYVGVFFRRNRKKHVPIMVSAIIWDILLVLQIELNRGAINTASKVTTNHWLMNFHVTIAVTTVLLYFVLLFTGKKLLGNDNSIRQKHKVIGMICLILRTLTYATSYIIKTV